jgi:hypothetical protein
MLSALFLESYEFRNKQNAAGATEALVTLCGTSPNFFRQLRREVGEFGFHCLGNPSADMEFPLLLTESWNRPACGRQGSCVV